MRVALAQINSHLGCFSHNAEKIIDYIQKAKERRCDIVLFPEAALFGYHPMDLLTRASVVDEQLKYINKIHKSVPSGMAVIFGAFTKNPSPKGKPYFNTAIALVKNKKIWSCHKELLPTYDVFDDARHIEPGDVAKNIFNFKGKKILITVCEDIWAWPTLGQKRKSLYDTNPIKKIKPGKVDLILNLSASPFYADKVKRRHHVVKSTSQFLRAPMAYVNMVGAQDELIFDGGSFAIDKRGKVLAQSHQFVEDINVVDFSLNKGGIRVSATDPLESLRQALTLGIFDFVNKIGMPRVHLGLSGGVDSALVACLAVDALGPSRVSVYALPGPFSARKSEILAQKLADNLGISITTLPVTGAYKNITALLDKKIGKIKFGLRHENLQARLRAIYLMAASNQANSLLLNTSNKSELAVGYSTLYGDAAGGLAVIGDLLKSEVYALAKFYNSQREIIPNEILRRAPSAELRKNQKDQDTLPSYNLLDQSVVDIVEKSKSAKSPTDKFLLKMLMQSEFKRWQTPPILKVRENSFGQGRRMPIAHGGWY
jgi:NAD+ synthase (glutamine-hydrolysing)